MHQLSCQNDPSWNYFFVLCFLFAQIFLYGSEPLKRCPPECLIQFVTQTPKWQRKRTLYVGLSDALALWKRLMKHQTSIKLQRTIMRSKTKVQWIIRWTIVCLIGKLHLDSSSKSIRNTIFVCLLWIDLDGEWNWIPEVSTNPGVGRSQTFNSSRDWWVWDSLNSFRRLNLYCIPLKTAKSQFSKVVDFCSQVKKTKIGTRQSNRHKYA